MERMEKNGVEVLPKNAIATHPSQIGGEPQFFGPTIYVISWDRAGLWTKQVLDFILNDVIFQYQ